eukprot:scaffold76250_cov27-Tisochrysis_lutea.AAC.2
MASAIRALLLPTNVLRQAQHVLACTCIYAAATVTISNGTCTPLQLERTLCLPMHVTACTWL